MEWQTIKTAPDGELLILYQPAVPNRRGDGGLPERIVLEQWPTSYPRKSTHWMYAPKPPKKDA